MNEYLLYTKTYQALYMYYLIQFSQQPWEVDAFLFPNYS